jgi:hypothetical protein
MSKVLIALAAFGCVGMLNAPVASADPIGDADDDIYGLVTQGERQEIWSSGQQSCQTLDRAFESNPPLKSDDVIAVIEGYRAEGWDLESASDITWESVEGRCPEYLDAVKRAVRTYGDPS